jgi:hypothetical protein
MTDCELTGKSSESILRARPKNARGNELQPLAQIRVLSSGLKPFGSAPTGRHIDHDIHRADFPSRRWRARPRVHALQQTAIPRAPVQASLFLSTLIAQK